eukprot:1000079-Pyramimonas_sp.AAC.2
MPAQEDMLVMHVFHICDLLGFLSHSRHLVPLKSTPNRPRTSEDGPSTELDRWRNHADTDDTRVVPPCPLVALLSAHSP